MKLERGKIASNPAKLGVKGDKSKQAGVYKSQQEFLESEEPSLNSTIQSLVQTEYPAEPEKDTDMKEQEDEDEEGI